MNRGITGRTLYPALASAAAILWLIACRGDMVAEQRLRDRHPAQATESRVSRPREELGEQPGGRRVRERAGTPEEVRRRKQMVTSQLQARDIADPVVLAVMGRVPRHLYVPEPMRGFAYADCPLPIDEGQTISQPYIVAYMTQALELEPGDRVLEIGTGSGYQAAVLAEIVQEVYTIEIVPELAQKAGALLNRLGYENIHVRTGDGYFGWPQEAPFDAIIVTAAPGHVPQALVDQLDEGAALVLPVGEEYQELVRIRMGTAGEQQVERLLPVQFVPMTGVARRAPEGDSPK